MKRNISKINDKKNLNFKIKTSVNQMSIQVESPEVNSD